MKQTEATSRLFRALPDETRLRIIDPLQKGEECVRNLTRRLATRQSLLSLHVCPLKDAGLLHDRKQARWVCYSLNFDAPDEMTAALEALKMPRKGRRDSICRLPDD